MTRRLQGATRAQIDRAVTALFDIRQRHLTEWADTGDGGDKHARS